MLYIKLFEDFMLINKRHFISVLDALLHLHKDVIRLPDTRMPTQIQKNTNIFPSFEPCLGALDRSHMSLSVAENKRAAFCNQKGVLFQNVFGVLTFDMAFAFVLASYEGSAHDGRVLRDAFEKRFSMPK